MGFLLLVLLSGGIAPPIRAQNVLEVDAKAIQQHIDHQVFPVYPPIAKAAHVQGTVVFDLRIGATGRIESMNVVSGPAMLQQAAIDCLKQWTFHPFEKDGGPVVAHGQYSIIFVLSDSSNTTIGHGPPVPQQEPTQIIEVKAKSEATASVTDPTLNDKFEAADDACWQLYRKHDNSREAGVACQKAADYMDEFIPETEVHEKLSEYLAAAWALANSGEALAARPYAEKAVQASSKTLDYTFGIGSAYAIRGIIEGTLHDLDASDRDLTQAEQFGRRAYQDALADQFKLTEQYKLYLVNYLRAHSALLLALHRDKEAKERLDEALSLQ
jgi:TonB family protein